jgi:hypothetical protein
MIWRLSRIRMGLLVIAMILLSDAITISQAIEFERLFRAAASKRFFFVQMSKGNSDDQVSSSSRSVTKACKDSDTKTIARTNLLSRLSLGRHASRRQKEKEQKCHSLYQECKRCAASDPSSSSTLTSTTTCSAIFSQNFTPSLEVRGGHTHSMLSNSQDHLIPHHTPLGLPLFAWKLIFQLILTAINVLCW